MSAFRRRVLAVAVGFSALLALGLAGSAAGRGTPAPSLGLTTVFGASSIPVGGSTSLTYTITNPSHGVLTGVAFEDILPVKLVVSATPSPGTTCPGGTLTAFRGSGSVALTGATLGAGATCTATVSVTGTSEGVIQDSTTASSAQGLAGSATANLLVEGPPSITTSFAPTSIALGATTTLSVTVQNPNATTTLSGIALLDTLPAGLVVASPSGAQGTCGAGMLTATPGSGTFSLAGGQLAPGAGCTVSLTVKATQTGTEQNTAGPVSSTQTGVAGSASATLTVTPTNPAPTVTPPSNPTPTVTPPSNPAATVTPPSNPAATVTPPSSPTATVAPPSNHFTVSHIKTQADGTITLLVKIPGPGRIDVLETAWNDNLVHTAVVLHPAAHRFPSGRTHTTTTHPGVIHLRVSLNAHGKRLVHHHTYPVTFRLWVSYTPTGGSQRKVGFYGLHLPR